MFFEIVLISLFLIGLILIMDFSLNPAYLKLENVLKIFESKGSELKINKKSYLRLKEVNKKKVIEFYFDDELFERFEFSITDWYCYLRFSKPWSKDINNKLKKEYQKLKAVERKNKKDDKIRIRRVAINKKIERIKDYESKKEKYNNG